MKNFYCAAALLVSLQIAHGQTTVAAWTFENDAVGVNNSPAASSGTGMADAIGMGIYPTPAVGTNTDDVLAGVTTGASPDTGANGVADGTNIWRIRAVGGTGTNAANGWSSAAPIGTQGGVFAAPTIGLTSLNTLGLEITFDWYATTQGEANLELAYTDDGTHFTDVPLTLGGSDTGLQVLTNATSTNTVLGSYVSDNILTDGPNNKAGQDWFTGLTATITDPLALNNANFAVEMVNASTGSDDVSTKGTALNNNSGNWRFDNVSVVATPEPSTGSLMIGSLGFLAAVISYRRKINRI